MATTTAIHDLPVPESTDIPDGPNQIEALANALDLVLPVVTDTEPSDPTFGLVWWAPTARVLKIYDGTSWDTIWVGAVSWQAAALASSFSVQSGSLFAAASVDAGGTVDVRGLVLPMTGGYTAGHTYGAAVTLPVGCRPGHDVFRMAGTNSVASSSRLHLGTDGTIEIVTGATAPGVVDISCLAGFRAEN